MYGLTGYTPLWCKSNFSFLEGASHPDELVDEAHRLGLRAIAVTDRDGLYGVVRAHLTAKALGIKLIIGSEISVEDGLTVVLLVKNQTGYKNICRIISKGRLAAPKGSSRVSWRTICLHAEGLIGLLGGNHNPLLHKDDAYFKMVITELKAAYGQNLYGVLARHHHAAETRWEDVLLPRAKQYQLPLVAATEVLYHTPARRPLQDVVTCIRHKVTLTTAGVKTKSNGEHYLKSAAQFCSLFEDAPDAVANTLLIEKQCCFSLDELRYRYPSTSLPDGTTSMERLRILTLQGAQKRYNGVVPTKVSEQLAKELALIDELDYPGYFLTMYEIVTFCQENHILCQGRGSAANSAVCFCLGITAIDPVRMELLFERFISKERAEPPDIDLDIEHERREEVIQHVYQRFGREHAAMVAVVIRYRPKSAVRDVGKVLEIPDTSLDRLAGLLSRYGHLPNEIMEQANLPLDIPAHKHLLEVSREILDFPRHLSIHPGGFLLGHEPIVDFVPVENGTMKDRTVIQWDKDDVEALALFKVDLLGLGALTHLHLCFDLLKQHCNIDLSMATIAPKDKKTYDMITKGDTIGVFQIESRAQMAMLPRLRPTHFYDLVIEVSIVRPGPITGGMVHPYLARRRGDEPVVYPHPCLEPVLKKTLGVPLFQEQVMKLAMVAADYTPGEADQLRRDMAAWRKSGRIERHRDVLVSRMMQKGIAEEFANRVFEQIRGFGEYGFPESHAASFALISYATAFLRCHYPAVFACGLLNAQPMGFYLPSTIVDDAKRNGVKVLPADINHSHWDCTLISLDGNTQVGRPLAIRMGLRYVKGFGYSDWENIENARKQGQFVSCENFTTRTGLKSGSLTKLAEAGAFDGFGLSRRAAIWELLGRAKDKSDSLRLPPKEPAPSFKSLDWGDEISWDYVSTGHSTKGHPLQPLRQQLNRQGWPTALGIQNMTDGKKVNFAGLVICRQRPSTAGGVVFMTLEDETGFVNLICWKNVFEQNAVVAKTSPFLGVTGTVQSKEGVTHLIAEALWKPNLHLRPQSKRSRDFK